MVRSQPTGTIGAIRADNQTGPTVAEARTYIKYGVGASKDFLVSPFQKFYVNASWFGGRDLDRFVQYQFGMFDDTRIHGVPTSGVRFAELAMLRGSYSFNVFEVYRLDLFLEHAWGRGKTSDREWQRIPGFGAAVNFRAPWSTILRTEVGKSVLPDRYSGLGSTTLQVLLLNQCDDAVSRPEVHGVSRCLPASDWVPSHMTGRVVITGVGLVTALGATREETWRRMLEGECGIRPVTIFDTSGYRSHLAGEVDIGAVDRSLEAMRLRRYSRSDRIGLAPQQRLSWTPTF